MEHFANNNNEKTQDYESKIFLCIHKYGLKGKKKYVFKTAK